MTKTLTINNKEAAKYEMNGDIIFLKVIMPVSIKKPEYINFENSLINIIEVIEKRKFTSASYLNI